MIQAVLFDLDGTLADTAQDLNTALNRLLAEEGLPPQPYKTVRALASQGARSLVSLGFALEHHHPTIDALRLRFLEQYGLCLTDKTCLFDGVVELIESLAVRGILWGIITNKPMYFTDRLVPTLPFPVPPAIVVSGDTVGVAKPDPRPMWYASKKIGVSPGNCLYVGDAKRDIDAGRGAGMKTVLAGWGYFCDTDQSQQWGADHYITYPMELLALL